MLAWGGGNAVYVKCTSDMMVVLFYSALQAYALYILINHILGRHRQNYYKEYRQENVKWKSKYQKCNSKDSARGNKSGNTSYGCVTKDSFFVLCFILTLFLDSVALNNS